MKANARTSFGPIQRLWHPVARGFAGCALMTALASCTASQAPVPAPRIIPAPNHALPAPTRPIEPEDWRDKDLTAGAWVWNETHGVSAASFAGGALRASLACHMAARSVTLLVAMPQVGPVELLAITTSTQRRQITPQAVAGGYSAQFASTDRLLDAMVFTRGRLMIELGGHAALILPADPAIGRVVEDCRK